MPTQNPEPQLELDLVRFAAEDRSTEFALDLSGETLWASADEIADLFHASTAAVTKQIAAVYADRELDPETTRRVMAARRPDGSRGASVGHYNLDLVLSVGYRVNSVKATAFRQWATRLLRTLVADGFVLDAARLAADRTALDSLAAKLRAIRAEEKNVYDSVRGFFAAGAADFEPDSAEARRFTLLLEDKFVFAVTGKSPADLILERADHDAAAMGLKTFTGNLPSMDEARIAQNYLDAHELFVVHMLCEQFLLLVHGKALRHEPMTMADLVASLDGLLRLNDYPVLPSRKDFHAARAIRHAQAEYARFILGAKTRAQGKLRQA